MKQVEDNDQNTLREKNLMSENEVAYTQGDLLVAVDVVTNQRRVLGKTATFLLEGAGKRVLKG